MNWSIYEEMVNRLTRAMQASPDEDGMILVTPELIGSAVNLLTELLEATITRKTDQFGGTGG